MIERKPSYLFFAERAEEMRSLAAAEPSAPLREQHLRIAAMYQALAERGVGRPEAGADTAAHPKNLRRRSCPF